MLLGGPGKSDRASTDSYDSKDEGFVGREECILMSKSKGRQKSWEASSEVGP